MKRKHTKLWTGLTCLALLFSLLVGCTGQEKSQLAGNQNVEEGVAEDFKVAEQLNSSKEVNELPSDSLPVWPALRTVRYVNGRFTASEHPAIVKVPKELTDGDGGYYLHEAALTAFKEMHAAAAQDGVKLIIVSAFRNFDRQKSIWEAKWTGKRLLEGKEKADEAYPDPAERALAILRYSSMPGSSRHHWGTDMDLNRLNNEYFASGEGKTIYDWLTTNAADFGFCQPYTPIGEERPNGYQEEKWHWSYLPVAEQLTDFAREHLTYEMIEGFQGAAAAREIEVIRKYVLGVSKDCKGVGSRIEGLKD